MFRAVLIIPILYLGVIFQGCATLEYLDASSQEETEKFNMTKDQIWNKMKKLRRENINLQRKASALTNENRRIRDENAKEMARIRDQNEVLNKQINKLDEENQAIRDHNEVLSKQINNLKEDNQGIRDQNQLLTKKLKRLKLKDKSLVSESYNPQEVIRKIRIKVLSGDGNVDSAYEMARNLRNMGYTIKLIDCAPESDFLHNTVYFAPKFQYEAERLVVRLGGNTIAKPLKWHSIFDLVVVTGKNP